MTIWEYLDRRANRRSSRRKYRPAFLGMTFSDWLGAFVVTAFIGALAYLLSRQFPKQNEQLIVYMLGQLSGFVGGVFTMHYGANKRDDEATINTARAFDAIKATAEANITKEDGG